MAENDRFIEAELRYRDAKTRFDRGRLSRAQFEEVLKALVLQDGQGRYWGLGALDGAWYLYDGLAWTRADPPGRTAPSPPTAAGASPGGPTEAALDTRRRRGRAPRPKAAARPRRRGCGRALLWILALATLVALAVWLAPRLSAFLPGLRPGACARLVGSVRTEVALGDRLTCTFGVADSLYIEQMPSREAALQRLAIYAQAQQGLVASLKQVEGFADRSSWGAEAAILDTQAGVSGQLVYAREGLLLYRDRYLIQVRLTNWADDAAMQRRWEDLAQRARQFVDAKFK